MGSMLGVLDTTSATIDGTNGVNFSIRINLFISIWFISIMIKSSGVCLRNNIQSDMLITDENTRANLVTDDAHFRLVGDEGKSV